MLFGKADKREGNKPRSDFEEGIWNQIIDCGTNRSVMPVRSYAVDKKRYYMWCANETLFFAPRILTDERELERIPLIHIKNYFVNPKDHNEICFNYSDEQGKKMILRFRSQALPNLRLLLGRFEHKFDSKTMALGKQERLSDIPKIGDLRDVRSGGEFEEYLTTLFQALGYHAENTKISGDQGVDVLVSKNGKRYGIQAKYYSQPVGNFAVQEILAGREYFKLSKGIVVTNATYTASAKDLAEKTQIRLIDGDELQQIIRLAKTGKGSTFIL